MQLLVAKQNIVSPGTGQTHNIKKEIIGVYQDNDTIDIDDGGILIKRPSGKNSKYSDECTAETMEVINTSKNLPEAAKATDVFLWENNDIVEKV